MPHLRKSKSLPVRLDWSRSAANTPNCAVKDERTRIVVLIAANVMLSLAVCSSHSPGDVALSVK